MIAVSVDYRLSERDGVEVPLDCVKDAKSAVRFLRQHADKLKVDPDRLVIAGGSAGGQLAVAMATLTSPETNDDCYDLSISCVPNVVVAYNPYYKCAPSLSPPNFVTEGLPPLITFLGDQDPAISVQSLLDFHNDARFHAAGVRLRYLHEDAARARAESTLLHAAFEADLSLPSASYR